MELKIRFDYSRVDWQEIANSLRCSRHGRMYKKLGFRAMKTGMALFTNPQATEKFTDSP